MQSSHTIYTILGIIFGDEGKGKIVHSLTQSLARIKVTSEILSNVLNYSSNVNISQPKPNSILCVRYCGGSNAGHTICIEGVGKIFTRQIPTGILTPNVLCMIGPASLVNLSYLKEEIKSLEAIGITDIKNRLLISHTATVVTDEHIKRDIESEAQLKIIGKSIGTTCNGIGPASSDKALRTAKIVRDFEEFKSICTVIDTEEFFYHNRATPMQIIFEGAQSTELNIHGKNYPYVTSSITGHESIYSTGVYQNVKENRVIYVVKAYETYIGAGIFQPRGEVFEKIAADGLEFGTVTGDPRQVAPFDIDRVSRSILRNCPKDASPVLIINKGDVLETVAKKYPHLNPFLIKVSNQILEFDNFNLMKKYLEESFIKIGIALTNIVFTSTPYSDLDIWNSIKY